MKLFIYLSFLVFALICSLFHVFKQIKSDIPPGEIVLQIFFLSFGILGVSSIFWILAVKDELFQSFGLLFNGLFMGFLTHSSIHLAFYLHEHKEVIRKKVKSSPEEPRYT